MTYNSAYTGPQIDKAARLASVIFDNLPAMLADARDYTAHTAGDVFWTAAEGFRYRVAASGAADHHLTTAGGVKLYVQPADDGVYNFGAFNPAGNDATDDYPVLMKAIGAATTGVGTQLRGPTILIPDLTFYMGQTIELKRIVNITGLGSGTTFLAGATFRFPANTRGIVINRADTFEGAEQDPATTTAESTVIRNLRLDGTFVTNDPAARDTDACGLRVKGACVLENVTCRRFAGDGFYVAAWVAGQGGDGDTLGNANGWQMRDCHGIQNGRHGLHVRGSDANAGTCIGGNFTYNKEFGIRDHSFLGNTYIGCHTATNGLGISYGNTGGVTHPNEVRGGSRVWYDGNIYTAVYKNDGTTEQDATQTAAYHTTVPGTDATVWGEPVPAVAAWNTYPAWQADQPLGTYNLGGGFFFSNNNARTLSLGSYSENDQGGNVYSGNFILVAGGIQEKIAVGSQIRGLGGGRLYAAGFTAQKTSAKLTSIYGLGDTPLEFSKDDHGGAWRLRIPGNDIVFDLNNAASQRPFTITGHLTTETFGSGEPQKYVFSVGQIGLGGRRHTTAAAAPTTGAWARGDIVWNRDPVAAGYAGWICVTAGTPGTWKRFGAIEA